MSKTANRTKCLIHEMTYDYEDEGCPYCLDDEKKVVSVSFVLDSDKFNTKGFIYSVRELYKHLKFEGGKVDFKLIKKWEEISELPNGTFYSALVWLQMHNFITTITHIDFEGHEKCTFQLKERVEW